MKTSVSPKKIRTECFPCLSRIIHKVTKESKLLPLCTYCNVNVENKKWRELSEQVLTSPNLSLINYVFSLVDSQDEFR